MKKLLLLAVLVGAVIPTMAWENPVPEHGQFSLSALYNTSGREVISGTGNLEGNGTFGVNLGYELPITNEATYGVSLGYITGSKDGAVRDYRTFLIGVGGSYFATENIFLKGGFNLSLPSIDEAGVSHTGRLGYEMGIGYAFNKEFSAELSYLQINMARKTGTATSTSLYDTVKLGVNYNFSL